MEEHEPVPGGGASDEALESTVHAEEVDQNADAATVVASLADPRGSSRWQSIPQPPITWRELLVVIFLIVICDLTIYRGKGFAGYALLFMASPLLLALATHRPQGRLSTWLVGLMLWVLAAKLLWCGSAWYTAVGFTLIVAFVVGLSGYVPYFLETLVCASQTVRAGYLGLHHYSRHLRFPFYRMPWLSVLLPLGALLTFGLLFLLANPELVSIVSERAEMILNAIRDWLRHFSALEVAFWIGVLWLTVGLVRPGVARLPILGSLDADDASRDVETAQAPLYFAFRNTLVTVIVLFTVYLVFEFATLWFREFEPGFYYSGYAHEGAAWLTIALALATAVLSFVFRGRILRDPRLSALRRLAWVWSIQNFLLAIAVYNRLSIYIDFNGMTRMRTVGLFGVSTVVIGFILVVWKIYFHRSFAWLVRRQLWTLALAIYLYAVIPVDALWVGYDVRRILDGDPAPSVEISVHPISAEGVLMLEPLLDCDHEIIREGVRAMLAERDQEEEKQFRRRQREGWTTYQIADERLVEQLRRLRSKWSDYAINPTKRSEALDRFHEYAYQWY